jgi:signal transduction histidine kinase
MNESLLRQILDIGRQMAETRALAPLLIYAVDVSITLLKAEYGYLILVKPDGSFEFRVARDEAGQNIPNPEQQVSKTVIYRVVEEGRAIISANAVTDFATTATVKALQLRSLLCVPMIARGRVMGVLYLENRNERAVFVEADIEPLQYLASYAAVCIENALLNEELEMLAHADHDTTQNIPFLDDETIERERMRLVYNFIQDASHQFRTPLSVINANIDVLSRKINNPSYDNYWDGIRGQVRAVVSLVESLLLMVRLDSVAPESLHVQDLNRLALEIFEVRLDAAKRKSISYQIATATEPIWARGVLEYMRQAVKQIIENAIQFTNDGGEIQLIIYRRNNYGIIEVRDTGIGLSIDEQKRVFTRFYRGDKAGTTRGLGLGLSIAQKIMQLHAGKIELESEEGQGTVVRMLFPIIKSES